ncbi:hypothetical protein RISK_003587 [Rhodopirellula islandica]|uniref:Uncharacterized protein n=1 Tax=Rhodopirellula islandica TaxID=595434 RepID=A0A0J1BD67_RHOIS|nr:hypothetical protein RISK_003587 [Rhodopirellula islandica]
MTLPAAGGAIRRRIVHARHSGLGKMMGCKQCPLIVLLALAQDACGGMLRLRSESNHEACSFSLLG